VELICGLPRNGEMGVMDGVESAAEQGQSHD
jgi:hypothetical protein